MKVRFKGIERDAETHHGEVVGYVNVPPRDPSVRKPPGVWENEPSGLPNIWAVVVEERSGAFCAVPLYNVKRLGGPDTEGSA